MHGNSNIICMQCTYFVAPGSLPISKFRTFTYDLCAVPRGVTLRCFLRLWLCIISNTCLSPAEILKYRLFNFCSISIHYEFFCFFLYIFTFIFSMYIIFLFFIPEFLYDICGEVLLLAEF